MLVNMFWTIYLGILGTVAIGYLIKGKYKTFPAKLDFVISIITWIGLFGYVLNIQIIHTSFWQIVFFGALFWDLLYSFFLADFGEEFEDVSPPVKYIIIAVIFVVLLGPLYVGLYQYAF
ncbi:hypothetical protein QTG56_10930 [Rossellomorea sp. AcN35-11]|nr:hypothetical protein [Rossellomorea aquimaris]WJV31389.1 hypothetical protein QTG56_10930 [Rossellomorea sp. AcN35-11]